MPYDQAFMARYAEYIREPAVWLAHDRALKWFFRSLPNYPDVFDLGCGIQEALDHRPGMARYAGFDLNPINNRIHKIDFETTPVSVLTQLAGFKPHAIISLFGIETALPCPKREKLYADIFDKLPSVQHILTSGVRHIEGAPVFYDEETSWPKVVIPDSDIESFLTDEPASYCVSDQHGEARYTQIVRSKMFGLETEVWKHLWRY